MIKRLAKLSDDVVTHEVLDCCHAAHHIPGALKALGLDEEGRLPQYREHREVREVSGIGLDRLGGEIAKLHILDKALS